MGRSGFDGVGGAATLAYTGEVAEFPQLRVCRRHKGRRRRMDVLAAAARALARGTATPLHRNAPATSFVRNAPANNQAVKELGEAPDAVRGCREVQRGA